MYNKRTKHINVKLQFIRNEVAKEIVLILKLHTNVNPADMFTKVLPTAKFEYYMNLVGILPNPN